jgi:hypothetical protein
MMSVCHPQPYCLLLSLAPWHVIQARMRVGLILISSPSHDRSNIDQLICHSNHSSTSLTNPLAAIRALAGLQHTSSVWQGLHQWHVPVWGSGSALLFY